MARLLTRIGCTGTYPVAVLGFAPAARCHFQAHPDSISSKQLTVREHLRDANAGIIQIGAEDSYTVIGHRVGRAPGTCQWM